MKKIVVITLMIAGIVGFSACYKNYHDISEAALNSINNISFRSDVVPICIAGGCGCHNNGTTRQVKFSHNDTIFYSTIQSRSSILDSMARRTAPHPGEGSVYFTPSQEKIIIKWVEQGAKDDYVPPPVTGPVTYTQHIVPLYKTDCAGGSCHGGAAPALDYTAFKNAEDELTTMMNSLGASGHPGGPLSIAPSTASNFLAWINQGFPY